MITQEPYKTLSEIKRTAEDAEAKIRAILKTWDEEAQPQSNWTADRLRLNKAAREVWLANINDAFSRIRKLSDSLPDHITLEVLEKVQANRTARMERTAR